MKKIRLYLKIFTVLVVFFSIYYLITMASIYSYGNEDNNRKADAAIVLGAAAWGNKPSPVLRERLNHAIGLYKSGRCNFLIFTGGKGFPNEPGESVISRRYAVKQGIPESKIFIENESKNTFENIKNAVKIADNKKLKSFFIVSDSYHLKRASVIAKQYGLEVYPSATTTSMFKSWSSRRDFLLKETNLMIILKVSIFLGIETEMFNVFSFYE